MVRNRNQFDRWRTAALIWISVVFLTYIIFKAALNNSRSPSAAPGSVMSSSERRERLYEEMSKDLEVNGPKFIQGGETSQSLSVNDIFEMKGGVVRPILKPATPPVRATVLYMNPEYSIRLSQAVKDIFLPYFDKVIWFQNTSLYHSSMFHASHHINPVFATDAEIEAEANAIRSLATSLCPLKVILDRVVLTSTGVLLGCWQVTSGTDPLVIRTKLKEVLPRAPKKQLYDPVMLHTSFARVLGRPDIPAQKIEKESDQLDFFLDLVSQLNSRLKGFQATMLELWFVEELDVLALALDGRMRSHRFPLGCSGS